VAARSSERERGAMQAEREVDSYFAALFLKDHVGEELDGVVCAVTDFGIFVELKEVFVEGLVKAETIGPGAHFDEQKHRLTFTRGPSFSLGTEVRVRVTNVSVARRQIDFQLLSAGSRRLPDLPPPERPPAKKRRPERRPKKARRRS